MKYIYILNTKTNDDIIKIFRLLFSYYTTKLFTPFYGIKWYWLISNLRPIINYIFIYQIINYKINVMSRQK